MAPGGTDTDILREITDLLVGHAYPPAQVPSWWHRWRSPGLEGRTPIEVRKEGQHQRVLDVLAGSYEVSSKAMERLLQDRAHVAMVQTRIAEMDARYKD